jgi:quercetin dioxygenase-like cupin family protein
MKTLRYITAPLVLTGLLACQTETHEAATEPPNMEAKIVRESDIQSGATSVEEAENNDQIIKILLGADDTGNQYTLFSDVFPEAESLVPLHMHALHDEAFYIVSGSFEITLGSIDNKSIATPGTTIFVPRETLHAFRTLEENSKVVIVYTPGGWEDYYNASLELTDDQRNDEAFMKQFRESWDSYSPDADESN